MRRSPCLIGFVRVPVLLAIVSATSGYGLADEIAPEKVDFNRDIRPIFNEHCLACHGGVKQSSGLSFIYRDKALAGGESGAPAIVPGNPDDSYAIYKVLADDDERMPPPDHGPRLSDHEIHLLQSWIEQGAEWAEHWSFVPPQPGPLPTVRQADWCREPLDWFVLARLERENLAPAPEADRIEWLRRATFDLTGLPPTLDEVHEFVQNDADGAYERAVDRLLESAAFGERWAAMWLDLARFADTQGYERDHFRTMWPYRDWVIRAFNSGMPFDEFTVKQLAGDLLPDATLDDIIATAFHRCSQTNAEGGTDDEEFRIAAVIDRVNTTWEVWQGVPFKCTQCHSHPYAPFEHPDFYRFFSVFNTTKDWDLNEDVPHLSVPVDRGQFARAREIDRRLSELRTAELAETNALAEETNWLPLEPKQIHTTGSTELVLKPGDGGFTEIWTQGTVTHGSKFTLDFTPPDGSGPLTALRIDVLPQHPEVARLTPELGFVISELKAFLVPVGAPVPAQYAKVPWDKKLLEDDKPAAPNDNALNDEAPAKEEKKPTEVGVPVKLFYAVGDEAIPFGTGQQSLEPDSEGWGAEPRITCARRLIVLPDEPIAIPVGSALRLVIRQDDAPHDMMPLVMGRGRYSASDDEAWTALATSDAFRERRDEMNALVSERKEMKSAELVVMAEQEPNLKRITSVFVRGNWLNKGDEVVPGLPKVFGELPEEDAPSRMRVAKWLVSNENPLTARVAVNRFWEQLFGIGIVETLEDFGPSGQPPSNPELLDFLALRFQHDLNWNVRELLRELVLSATYRQSSRVSPELLKRDPRNQLLARGPRNRLTAEMVRDNALSISGLIQKKMYGLSVMPPQPAGIGQPPYNAMKWQDAEGEDRYRRAVYTFLRRSNAYPGLVTFDAPSRIVCTARRVTTNTPLQALATMNDPVYIECAVALAGRMMDHSGSDTGKAIEYGYELATGRLPDEADRAALASLHDTALHAYQADGELSNKLAPTPEKAAMTLLANAIMNLDAVLTK